MKKVLILIRCCRLLTSIAVGACAAAAAADPAPQRLQTATLAVSASRGSVDPQVHARAEQEVAGIAAVSAEHPRVRALQGWLEMSRHRFAAALDGVERALAVDPGEPIALALRVDALTELGRYDEALAAAQALADHEPPVVAYPRASHLRFLHGDLDGAIELARLALQHAPAGHADHAWLTGDLANLLVESGQAQAAIELLRSLPPRTAQEHAWLARAMLAAGDSAAAASQWRTAHALVPMPEYALALWKLARDRGDAREQARYKRLLQGQARLDAVQGGLSNRDFIEFHALDGKLARANELARAEWERRPDIYSAAQLAWVLRAMRREGEAAELSRNAMRLGTRSLDLARWLGADAPAPVAIRPAVPLVPVAQ